MDKIIHCVTNVHCEVDQAFQFFIDNTLLESWLTIKSDVVPEVHGRYELFWTPEDRDNNSTIGCTVTTIEENQLISFEWRSPIMFKHFANVADPLTHVVVSFIRDEFGTVIHLIHSGWRSTVEWEAARVWQEHAWNSAFGKLQELINERNTVRELGLF